MNKLLFARRLRKNQTDAEKLLWHKVRNRQLLDIKFRRQQPIGEYIVDFISFEHKIIIEIDGGQHNENNNVTRDQSRTDFLESEGFTVLRFWNNDVLQNLEGLLESLTLTLSHTGEGKRLKINT